ncbi:glh-1 [Pristionchus pacificus]|uniref:RNA helicase n=1 Tax=Pristionchus pacificus TaxID=54126 RepID=A0A2A6BNM1_PRIPA|nr:glh-1 [Pristionchus pacificus]|eukprot:PDM67504.1 glh-1 [Pristionchus pacificus]
MIQVGDTRRVAQADGRGFSKLGMEESGSESRPPVASARMENGEAISLVSLDLEEVAIRTALAEAIPLASVPRVAAQALPILLEAVDSVEARPEVVADSGEAHPEVAVDSEEARPEVVADSAEARPEVVADSAEARPEVVADSAEARPEVVADSGEAHPEVAVDSAEALPEVAADSAEALPEVAADSAEHPLEVVAVSAEAHPGAAADLAELPLVVEADSAEPLVVVAVSAEAHLVAAADLVELPLVVEADSAEPLVVVVDLAEPLVVVVDLAEVDLREEAEDSVEIPVLEEAVEAEVSVVVSSITSVAVGAENEGHTSTECDQPPNPDKKPASTHIPEEYETAALFKEHIEQGSMFDKFFDQSVELSLGSGRKLENAEVLKIETFEELFLPDLMASNVKKAGYSKPTPIQKFAMRNILDGKDLMACSQTGSGKTAAFLLPIMSKLTKDGDLSNISETTCAPRVLILAPTRELAIQIHKEATKFSSGTMCRCEILYGGTSVRYQKERVQKGATILVGTTGRIKHFIDEGIVTLDRTKYLILDEADRMLDMGFSEDINLIMQNGKIAEKEVRQTLMFSATFPSSVQELVKQLLKEEYLMIVVDKIGAANKCITQDFVQVAKNTKKSTLLEMVGVDIKKYEQNKDLEIFKLKTLIFVSSKKMADSLGVFLSESGIPTTTIHGDREQNQREQALNDFRRGRTPILIATAVAERGLDISGVDHVINFDMPKEIDEYVHRIGRTGRVGNAGHSTSFIDAEHDAQLIAPLINLLSEAEQIVPDWLSQISGGIFNTDAGFGGDGGGSWGGEESGGGGW